MSKATISVEGFVTRDPNSATTTARTSSASTSHTRPARRTATVGRRGRHDLVSRLRSGRE